MESIWPPVNDELRKGEDPIGKVLHLIIEILEAFIHLVDDWNHLSYSKIDPGELSGADAFGWSQVGHHSEYAHPEFLVDVALHCPIPVERLVVLSVNELVVVL